MKYINTLQCINIQRIALKSPPGGRLINFSNSNIQRNTLSVYYTTVCLSECHCKVFGWRIYRRKTAVKDTDHVQIWNSFLFTRSTKYNRFFQYTDFLNLQAGFPKI